MSETFDAPQSRNEAILQNMLGANNTLPAPQSRIEELLQEILEQGQGGGLPPVTPLDDGKILKVQSGSWKALDEANLIEIDYANLVALRDAGKLVAGMQYRITDYETIINGTYDLSAMGAEGYIHYARSTEEGWFDIIVTADDESHLNENARAARNADYTDYAPDAHPEAWEIKYCLDNDTTRFAWADSTNGKGVIYWMKDEHNNSAGYDFKSIQFLRYALKLADATADYTPVDTGLVYDASTQPNRYGSHYYVFLALQGYMQSGNYVNPFVMYFKGNEANNYDFSVGYNILGTIQFPEADDTYLSTFNADWYYTFDYLDSGGTHWDISSEWISGVTIPTNNRICECQDGLAALLDNATRVKGLPCNVFEANSEYLSDSNQDCYNNTIGRDSQGLTLGSGCYGIEIGSKCSGSIFADNCNNITFGDDCYRNVLGDLSCDTTFETNCAYNLLFRTEECYFGVGCKYISSDGSRILANAKVIGCDTITLPALVGTGYGLFEVIGYTNSSLSATMINKTAYNTETAVSTTDGGATWA